MSELTANIPKSVLDKLEVEAKKALENEKYRIVIAKFIAALKVLSKSGIMVLPIDKKAKEAGIKIHDFVFQKEITPEMIYQVGLFIHHLGKKAILLLKGVKQILDSKEVKEAVGPIKNSLKELLKKKKIVPNNTSVKVGGGKNKIAKDEKLYKTKAQKYKSKYLALKKSMNHE